VLADESFTAGLLHDVGKAVLLAEMADKYANILSSNPGCTIALELEHLGCTHPEVGAYLMSIWGLPLPLVHAVAFHHNPMDSGENQFSSLTAVHVADAIRSLNDPSPLNHDIELDMKYLERLAMVEREPIWRGFYEEQIAATKQAEVVQEKITCK
jgi:Predicted signal transduction protein